MGKLARLHQVLGPTIGPALGQARRFKDEVFSDHLLMVASGMAFHGVFGVLPALAAVAAVAGLVVGPDALSSAIEAARTVLPDGAVDLIKPFVTSVPKGLGFGIGLLINLAFILWSAQRAASGLITALNIVYDEREKRGRMHRAGVALGIAVGGMGLLLVALAVLALPLLLRVAGMEAWLLGLLRWPALALLFALALAVLFRVGPSREHPRWSWVSWGAGTGTLLWVAASLALSLYVRNAGSYGRYYGSLGGAVILLLWFYVSALSVLIGAEINAEIEQRREGRAPSDTKRALRSSERADPT